MIHIYHGDGKGKTTAAVGLAVRALGCGQPVVLAQFLKGGETGEVTALARFPAVEILRNPGVQRFTFQMDAQEKADCAAMQTELLNEAARRIRARGCGLLVLDEVLDAVGLGFLPEADLLALLRSLPDTVEAVLTGRGPSEELLRLSDYVTCMKKEKHPFDRGSAARRGVEY